MNECESKQWEDLRVSMKSYWGIMTTNEHDMITCYIS